MYMYVNRIHKYHMHSTNDIDLKIEKAVRMLAERVPYDETRKKLILPHCLRVGCYLYQHRYDADIILGGLLHDIIEWTESSDEAVRENFGARVADIVLANTQDRTMQSKVEMWQDMIDRCVECGEGALIVKAADVLDSHGHYTRTDNADEIERCTSIGRYILSVLPATMDDPIFNKLRNTVERGF